MSTILITSTPSVLEDIESIEDVKSKIDMLLPPYTYADKTEIKSQLCISPVACRIQLRRKYFAHDLGATTVKRAMGCRLSDPLTDVVMEHIVSEPVTPTTMSPPTSPLSCSKSLSRVASLPQSPIVRRRDFLQGAADEPHAQRRRAILARYPEIRQLMCPESRTKWMVLGTVLLQGCMAVATADWQWPAYITAVYVLGATANHSLMLAIHECSHGLASESAVRNKLIALIANIPIGFPYCFNFKTFHMLHHTNLGGPDDADIPTRFEAWLVTTSSTCRADHVARKALFLFFNVFAYALRPMFVNMNVIQFDAWLVLNWVVQFAVDAAVMYACGTRVLGYLFLSTFIACSIHPTAAHFIAEHYVMHASTSESDVHPETFSYHGILNYLTYNVGFHEVHHDFPSVAWSNLPKVYAIASEFYDDIPVIESWIGVIVKFIFDDSIGLTSRVRRGIACEKKRS